MTLNTAIFEAFKLIQTPALTLFSKTIATITEPLNALILAIIISAYLYYKNQKSQAILLASTLIFTAAIIKILKEIIRSPRPISNLILETSYSFPSGHTTFSIVFLGLLTYIFAKPKYKIPATITSTALIAIIIFSRLYLQVHWLTDIIGGIVIGTIILLASILIHKHINK
ncbi:MAG: phosphatase PAP2 family protein [archaeon]